MKWKIGRICTKDGRRMGNAFIKQVLPDGVCLIETDFGNRTSITFNEVDEFFYPQTDGLDCTSYQNWTDIRKTNVDRD